MVDEVPAFSKLEDAYSSVITSKVMAATSKQKKKFKQSNFRADVLSYYKASRTGEGALKESYCHLTG
jgi:hypothetical protein